MNTVDYKDGDCKVFLVQALEKASVTPRAACFLIEELHYSLLKLLLEAM